MQRVAYRKAFSLLELIFVIVILGIVASVGSSIIVQVYESYIMQRSIHNASIKTELAINQLANRLVYRIDESVVARIRGNTGSNNPVDIVPLSEVTMTQADTHRVFEWISYEDGGFSGSNPPAWSGFVDLDASNFNTITSTGSTLSTENTILNNLFPGHRNPAILFKGEPNFRTDAAGIAQRYNATCMYGTNGCMFPVTLAGNTITFQAGADRNNSNMIYTEFYQLAGSAYAVVPDANSHTVIVGGTPVWDLTFHSNYQPWNGENYTQARSISTLLRNVSVFRFKQEENSVRIKLCVIEAIGDTEISICKEKAVIR